MRKRSTFLQATKVLEELEDINQEPPLRRRCQLQPQPLELELFVSLVYRQRDQDHLAGAEAQLFLQATEALEELEDVNQELSSTSATSTSDST